ncbi:MAG: UDP-N-acetylmuramoyl-tripeptide--D-alanyl-D-alanine ligase [Burkholderiaceae bacterium]|nr:UDP-N-acetylmuramoyl-tripeptide--D-alanyl-D-alanine ligase [Burkholderiaceae bacterium]
MMNLREVLACLPGARLAGSGDITFERVHTDTRSLRAGDLFVALKGERFDANEFLAQASASGAVAAIAHPGALPAGMPGIEVADTRLALGALAAGWRRRFQLPLIAVTGSNGKTTVTQMIASVLSTFKGDAALSTQGNLNNDIGLPLTLLRLRAAHAIGVVELGMNHPGEIAYLADIASPTVALVNNAQREHLEFMATVEAVARENGAVITSLAPEGVAVYPAGDAYTPIWDALAGGRRRMTFGAQNAAVSLGAAQWQSGAWAVSAHTPAGLLSYRLRIAGRHNVLNSLAAIACTLAAGVPLECIAQGLARFEPVKGRSRALSIPRPQGGEITVIDDTYNANPDSVRAAIDVLAELPGPRLLVLGDMGEVGEEGPRFHAEVGAHAAQRGIERLFTLGAQSVRASAAFGTGALHFDDIDTLCLAVRSTLAHSASMLIKGSRFMKMERVLASITDPTPHPEQTHAA